MNNWNAISAFYKKYEKEIFSEPAYEWGLAAYMWDEVPGMIDMTPIEAWLWADLRGAGAVVYPQYPVGRYFVDFASPVAKVAIECDGAAFHKDKAKDHARDEELRALGWEVYRISGSDCRTEADEETGESGTARKFIDNICLRHGITRDARPYSEELVSASSLMGWVKASFAKDSAASA